MQLIIRKVDNGFILKRLGRNDYDSNLGIAGTSADPNRTMEEVFTDASTMLLHVQTLLRS